MPPTTTITIESQQSPTNSSNSHSESFTDEEGSSGTGVHVRSNVGSQTYSDGLDEEEWDPVYSDEIEPSDSASRPPTTQRYRTRGREPPATTRAPTRRHTTTEKTHRRPARVHRHPAPVPPSSVDPFEGEYPGYGRGHPAPTPNPYGGGAPRPGYAQSAYSVPGGGPYAPPYSSAPGALTHYGAPSAFQYPGAPVPPGNPFSPQPTHSTAPPPGAGYFSAPHHPMSGHSTPGGYPGHEMMPYGHHGFGGGAYPGYPQPGMPAGQMHGMQGMPQHMQFYPPQWSPPSDISASDPEMEKKMLAIEENLKNQTLLAEKAQKALADRDAKEAAAKAELEASKKAAADAAEAAKKAAEDHAAWEKRLEEERKLAMAKGIEAAKAAEAAAAEAAKKAAEDKLAWERKLQLEWQEAMAKGAAAARAAEEAAAAAVRKANEEKAAWEKKLEEERKIAMAQGMENAKKAQEAAIQKAAEIAAEEKAKADAVAELAKVKADAAAEAEKLKKAAAEEAEKLKKEHDERIKGLTAPPPADAKAPIRFKDAVGRKFSFPFHLCSKWAGMDELIQQAFLHVDVIGHHVREGRFDLIGPNGEIILKQVWETMIEPDWQVTMVMWPMPEPRPPHGMGLPPGPGGRPHSGQHRSGHGRPPVPPPVGHRGGPPLSRPGAGPAPPPPANWPGGPPARPMGGPAPVINVTDRGERRGSPPRPSRRKTEPKGAFLGWMAGKPAKPSGKGPKKAEQNDACRVM